ncbi:threonine synthase [Flavihumibacter solisilvae]|uniref:Threonine synthase n=1 Tax=Flavihumibacter solisilvae TaxID=1349421 RepID=A0A0C1L338_9BACT|nr:threonine synthase [Flavihumibacter solisilvae]KIC94407.1 threonine synthase [Flavihumibacter solisilvae]
MKTLTKPFTFATRLKCANCDQGYPLSAINTYAKCCNQPLVVEYDPSLTFHKTQLESRQHSMWRYAEMLPVFDRGNIVSLGEGMTPLFPLSKLASNYGIPELFIKDESVNPTGSFKARGISAAVSKAKELGITRCIVPTAGNAGGALAAYCAKAGMECTVVMPRHTPAMFKQECEMYGAVLILVDGLINDCAKKTAELNSDGSYFDVSTLKEPYRLEGKKTMGYEIAEQLNWQLPDVILYPAGGGTGLIGIWKAFKEMMSLGWISGPLPRMIAVQSKSCAPILYALKDQQNWKNSFTPRPTIANGLAVPYPFGMDMMVQVLEESGGMALAVDDEEIAAGVKEIARTEGLLIAPEGAATWKALLHLVQGGQISRSEKVLLLNTGSGYKYLDNFA